MDVLATSPTVPYHLQLADGKQASALETLELSAEAFALGGRIQRHFFFEDIMIVLATLAAPFEHGSTKTSVFRFGSCLVCWSLSAAMLLEECRIGRF